MGQSIETVVRVVTIEKDYWGRHQLTYVQHEEYPNDEATSELAKKAAKALKGVQPGDRVEVVWDYDMAMYPIVKARRLTGTLEARVEALEAALKAAGIDIPELR